MSGPTNPTAINVTASDSGQESKQWTGVNLLLVVIYGGLAVLLVVIFTQRALVRLKQKYTSGYVGVGKGAPKVIKQNIKAQLENTLQVILEPQLLREDDARYSYEATDPENQSLANYVYRMKAVDAVKQIDKSLESVNYPDLCRPPLKSLKQHLLDLKSHSSGIMRAVRTNQIIALSDAYNHARFSEEPFGKEEFEKYYKILQEILQNIGQKPKKKTKKHRKGSSSEGKTSDKLPLVKEKDE